MNYKSMSKYNNRFLPFRNTIWLYTFCALSFFLPISVTAHQANTSITDIVLRDGQMQLRFILGERTLLQAFSTIDTNNDGILWRPEIIAGVPQVFAHLESNYTISSDGQPLILERNKGIFRLDSDGDPVMELTFSAPYEKLPYQLSLKADFLKAFIKSHRNFTKILVPQSPVRQIVFSQQHNTEIVTLREKVSILSQVGQFTISGIEHIFEGYDHIMFLLALIIVGGRLSYLFKIVTAFTIAHSITLILAALEIIILPDKWIEAGIALSIAYVALENFWLKNTSKRWILTFIFGLVHGFGFANVLREVGLPTEGLITSLLAFNIGVELGQITIVAIAFPLFLWLNRQIYHRQAVLGISTIILLFGLAWFIERIFDLSYMPL